MSSFDYSKSMFRYSLFASALTILAIAVLAKGFYIMTVQRSYWQAVDSLVKRDSILVKPIRGSILSDNGQQLACNLPEYRIYMDFVALKSGKADTLWHDSLGNDTQTLNELCRGLNSIFPEKSAEQFKEDLKEAYDKDRRHYPIVKRRIDYNTYNRVKALPIFRLRSYTGGFTEEKFMVRNKPYGNMAYSIIGDTYKEKDEAFSGLEKAFDEVLKGRPGFKHRSKILNSMVDIVDSNAVNGMDIVTTIDVGIQDLAERALIKELRKDNAYTGVAIVMEVETGDIKAMVNMDLNPETGEYYEGRNHAIADMLEPGSVFKTASFLVALDDGKIDSTNIIHTGNGIWEIHGAKMKDHNWHRGGYGDINVSRALQVSSNIGVSWLINKHYGTHPEDFVKGLYRVGIGEDLDLPFPEYEKPRIRMPKKNSRGQWLNWSAIALPWMSIGYETQVPPISVVTFYNAIANNGKMVRPRFVKRIEKDGEVVQEFPVEVLKEKIYKHEDALHKIQDILYKVVDEGLGKRAGSTQFHVSGKTGTAQKASGGGYKRGVTNYLLSFCGYFPSDLNTKTGERAKPKYSCIVCIQKAGLPASGGLMSGQVFHDIAEGIMAKNVKCDVKSAKDEQYDPVPIIKWGNPQAAKYVTKHLNIQQTEDTQKQKTATFSKKQMPDVIGMGARDAVYAIESRGGKVTIIGTGKVKKQSKAAGTDITRNEKIILEMG